MYNILGVTLFNLADLDMFVNEQQHGVSVEPAVGSTDSEDSATLADSVKQSVSG